MTTRDFQPVLAATSTPNRGPPIPFVALTFKDALKLPTLLAIGALAQAIVYAVLPARYALVPAALLVARSAIVTIIQSRSPKDNAFTADTIYGRVTSQLPSPATGAFGSQPAAQPLVVFHLGVSMNHPLGFLAPGGREINDHFQAMMRELDREGDEFGLLGSTSWRACEHETNNTLLLIMYFRDVESLNRFAHARVHREGWDWYLSFARRAGHKHMGILHETFVTQPGQYETIYVDCKPTLLGAANIPVGAAGAEKRQGPGGEGMWTRPLVSADHPALRSQSRRMASTPLGHEGKADMY